MDHWLPLRHLLRQLGGILGCCFYRCCHLALYVLLPLLLFVGRILRHCHCDVMTDDSISG